MIQGGFNFFFNFAINTSDTSQVRMSPETNLTDPKAGSCTMHSVYEGLYLFYEYNSFVK